MHSTTKSEANPLLWSDRSLTYGSPEAYFANLGDHDLRGTR